MIFIANPFMLPLLVLIWSIDAWLYLASARLILGAIPKARTTRIYCSIAALVDPLPQYLKNRLSVWTHKTFPEWLPWFLAMMAILLFRHLFMSLALSIA